MRWFVSSRNAKKVNRNLQTPVCDAFLCLAEPNLRCTQRYLKCCQSYCFRSSRDTLTRYPERGVMVTNTLGCTSAKRDFLRFSVNALQKQSKHCILNTRN